MKIADLSNIVTHERLVNTIKKIRAQYEQRGISIFCIGDGYCSDFASDVVQELDAIHSSILYEFETLNFCKPYDDSENMIFDVDLTEGKWGIELPSYLKTEHGLTWLANCTHVWLYLETTNKHYDAAAPDGVNTFIELPFFVGNFNHYKKMNNI